MHRQPAAPEPVAANGDALNQIIPGEAFWRRRNNSKSIKQILTKLFECGKNEPMQSNKDSKKTSKIADKSATGAPEKIVASDVTVKPRASRSSKTKKSEEAEMTSGKHHHKLASASSKEIGVAPATELGNRIGDSRIDDVPARKVRHEEIAELAYQYFTARGFTHGSAEEDWLRAERDLRSR